jgi:hypothetical protein
MPVSIRAARRPLRAARVPVRAAPRVLIVRNVDCGAAFFGWFGPNPRCDSLSIARRVSGGFFIGSSRLRGIVGPGRLAGFALPALRG